MDRILLLLLLCDSCPQQHQSPSEMIPHLLTVFDNSYDCLNDNFNMLMAILDPPSILSTGRMLFMDDNSAPFVGNFVWGSLCQRRSQFYNVTGETQETFLQLYGTLVHQLQGHIRNTEPRCITRRNCVLMTFMWLRAYPSYVTLGVLFRVSDVTVHYIVHRIWPILYDDVSSYITWPSRQECIDGTFHEINIPQDNQRLYFSGHRQYHCIHTQVIIDNELNIRHVASGFRGHNNDAQTFRMMTPIGDGMTLDLPLNCYLLGDCIYPSRHPLITPFTSAQIRRRPAQNQLRRFNQTLRRYRIYVEHIIHLLKIFRNIGTLFRQRRRNMARIVCLCACLAARRTKLFFGE